MNEKLNKDNWYDIKNILDYLSDTEKEILTLDEDDKEYYKELKEKVQNEYEEYCSKLLEPTADEMLEELGYFRDDDNGDGIWYENDTIAGVTYFLGFLYNDEDDEVGEYFVKHHYWLGCDCYESGYLSPSLVKAIAKKLEELDKVGWKNESM